MTKINISKQSTRARKRLQVTFPDDGLTQQHFREETDINTIMDKYRQSGQLPAVNSIRAAYGDFTSVADYQLHLNQVIAAQEAFDALPSRVRARFNNDPASLLAFLDDPANAEEAEKLGLTEPRPSPPQPKGPEGRQEPSEKATDSSGA